MNPRKLRAIGLMGAIVVTVLTAMVFYRSVQADAPNWKMLIMSCGMAFFLFYLVFSNRGNYRKK